MMYFVDVHHINVTSLLFAMQLPDCKVWSRHEKQQTTAKRTSNVYQHIFFIISDIWVGRWRRAMILAVNMGNAFAVAVVPHAHADVTKQMRTGDPNHIHNKTLDIDQSDVDSNKFEAKIILDFCCCWLFLLLSVSSFIFGVPKKDFFLYFFLLSEWKKERSWTTKICRLTQPVSFLKIHDLWRAYVHALTYDIDTTERTGHVFGNQTKNEEWNITASRIFPFYSSHWIFDDCFLPNEWYKMSMTKAGDAVCVWCVMCVCSSNWRTNTK